MVIKAIETQYRGYKFRSRLEARWAVFFDACGYQWEYEPEGFALPCGTYYLPDFKIFGRDSNGDYNVFYIEVKASEECLTDPKVEAFRNALWQEVERRDCSNRTLQGYGDFIVLDGPPDEKLYFGTYDFAGFGGAGRQWHMGPEHRGRPSFWSEWGECKRICLSGGRVEGIKSPIGKARSARFEHGESPE